MSLRQVLPQSLCASAFLANPVLEPGFSLKTPLGERLVGFYKPPPQPFQPEGDHRGNFGCRLGMAVLSAGFLPRFNHIHCSMAVSSRRLNVALRSCSHFKRTRLNRDPFVGRGPRLSPRSPRCLNEVEPVCCWLCRSR